MVAWGPFKKQVATHPRTWTLATAAKQGVAWGYRWKLAQWPGAAVRFSMRGGTFRAEGAGRLTVVTPAGKTVKAALPFSLKGKSTKPRKLPKSTKPLLSTDKTPPVKVAVSPTKVTGAQPLTVSFTTTSALPVAQEYELVITYINGGCGQTSAARVRQPAVGKVVSATLSPPADPAQPAWCKGTAYAAVLAVDRKSTGFVLGDILGYVPVTVS
jgi:hypothetical protein